MMNKTWRQIPVAFSLAISMYTVTEGIYNVWWIAVPYVAGSHLIPKQQKASVLKVKRLYNDLSCVRTGVFRLSVPLIFFFLLYPSIISLQLFCTPLLLWKGVMHLESDYIPSMFVSSGWFFGYMISLWRFPQWFAVPSLCLSSSWALAYLLCYIKHIAQWRLPVNSVVCLWLCALYFTVLS